MLRILRRWLRFGRSHSPPKDPIDIEDEAYEQNKTWITIVLQLVYLLFLCCCLPYVFLLVPEAPKWLPLRTFFIVSGACSLCVYYLYFKYAYSRPMYLSLVAYGVVFPYIVWVCERQYMVTCPSSWNWLTLSMVLLSLLSSSKEGLWLLLLQILTPAVGAVVDIYVGYGLDTNRFVLRALSIIVPDITIYFVLLFFSQVLAHSRDQALLRHELGQSILRNILPMPVADQLMENLALSCRINIAHDYSMATVAFCDIVGFTQLCLTTTPASLVDTLNDIFTFFDRLCLLHGVEKIKTIGDAYMFAGFPANDEPANEAAVAVVHVAVGMVRHMATFCIQDAHLQIRAGVNSGPVVAGVIGCTKFAYDIWGPTVNMASRLESSGLPGEVQLSVSTRELLEDKVPCIFRGNIALKGAGSHDTFLVDLPNVPATVATPEMLENLGLADMAYLVQEINRRQASYMFSAKAAVTPLSRSASATLSPRSPNQRPGRHGPLSPTSWRRRSVLGTPLSMAAHFQVEEEQLQAAEAGTRTNRIQQLLAAAEGSHGGAPSVQAPEEEPEEPLQPISGSSVFSRRTRSCIVTGQLEPVPNANLNLPECPSADNFSFGFPRAHTLNIDLDIHCPTRGDDHSDEGVTDTAAEDPRGPIIDTQRHLDGTASPDLGSPTERAVAEGPRAAPGSSTTRGPIAPRLLDLDVPMLPADLAPSPRRVTLNLNHEEFPSLQLEQDRPAPAPQGSPPDPSLRSQHPHRGSGSSNCSRRASHSPERLAKNPLHASPPRRMLHLSPPRRSAANSHASPKSNASALSQSSCLSPKTGSGRLRAIASLSRMSPNRAVLPTPGGGSAHRPIVPQWNPHAPDTPPPCDNPRHRQGTARGRSPSESLSPPNVPPEDWKECFLPPFMRKASAVGPGVLSRQHTATLFEE